MNVGVQWVLRDGEDPLVAEARESAAPRDSRQPAAAAGSPSVSVATAPTAVTAVTAAATAPATPAMVRRGPMATRLRRQQAAATPGAAAVGAVRQMPSPAEPIRPSSKPAARIVPSLSGAGISAPAGAVQADPQIVADLREATWESIKAIADRCNACPMAKERTNTVVADGAPGCPIVMIGEAPGREEDLSGVPFVGNSGKLLTEILKACGLERGKQIAICNVLKCRPPGNRDPRPEEVAACSAFLDRQLELLEPKLLVLMGKHAVQRILGQTGAISQMRGRLYQATIAGRKVPAVVTYHPSYLLRNPVAKELGWHDILFAKRSVPKIAT